MKDLRTLFIRWYFNQFTDLDPLYIEMSKICEDSPWHRERSVAIHTDMVVGEYLSRMGDNFTKKQWSNGVLMAAFACAFHDVGKPATRLEAYKPERGTYYNYHGHELVSARLWEDWAVRNWKFLKEEFGFRASSIHSIGWLIENHRPCSIKKSDKRHQLVLGVLDTVDDVEIFINIIKADTWGRISDDQVEKRQSVDAWCEEFRYFFKGVTHEYNNRYVNPGAPVMYMPIASSGSGKTTLLNSEEFEKITKSDGEILHFSMDVLRQRWYDPDDYANAFKLACEDKQFMNKINAEFVKLLKTGKTIYVDNINISKKRRVQYIQEARKHGYDVTAILFPVDLQTVLDRQESRPDKSVPLNAVKQQYMRLSLPTLGEVDEIIIYESNLPS